jgi:hypothetical protein
LLARWNFPGDAVRAQYARKPGYTVNIFAAFFDATAMFSISHEGGSFFISSLSRMVAVFPLRVYFSSHLSAPSRGLDGYQAN